MRAVFVGILALQSIASNSFAADITSPAVTFEIVLHAGDGTEIVAGQVGVMDGKNGKMSYTVDWDDSKFSDQFLSMRPFKCLDGPKKQWCRVPYPYEIKREVSPDDLTDLEYDLLFIWKNRNDYGIDMWNGVYYKLEQTHVGFGGLMHEMDMDILSAPPDDGNLRPIGEFDLEPAEPDGHWLPVLELRPQEN